MYCVHCGNEISDKAAVCVRCGRAVDHTPLPAIEGKVSRGWWWLGFFIPLVGLLLFLFLNDTEPKKAKKAGWGALVGAIVSVASVILIYLIWFLLFFFMVASA